MLPDKILPFFWDQKNVCVWFAGCSGGEEVYSFKIIWEMLKKKHTSLPALKATACDLNPENLIRAQNGIYSPSSLKEAKPEILSRFFEKGPTRKSLAVKSFLKNNITWEKFDLLKDQIPSDAYDIVFLRNNILTYSDGDLKRKGFNHAVSALADAGILIIGAKEQKPESINNFESFELPYMFQKQGYS